MGWFDIKAVYNLEGGVETGRQKQTSIQCRTRYPIGKVAEFSGGGVPSYNHKYIVSTLADSIL